jgi:transposase-like protein
LLHEARFGAGAVSAPVQPTHEAKITEAIGATKGEGQRRVSYRGRYYGRSLITRVGTLEFSAELLDRVRKKALVATLAEKYVQGASTRESRALRSGSKR